MSKISYINISPELEMLYRKNLRSGNRFVFSRNVLKKRFPTRSEKKKLKEKTYMVQASNAWKSMTSVQQQDWSDKAEFNNMSGWQLFLQDFTARQIEGIEEIPVLSSFHQTYVAELKIESPAISCEFKQEHPRNYYEYKKQFGRKEVYDPVSITEDLVLPFTFDINYEADLTSAGLNPYAFMAARFWYSYHGENKYYDLSIPLLTNTSWKNVSDTLTGLYTYIIGYSLILKVNDLQGTLRFDNIKATHSGQNWARDPNCNNVQKEFFGPYNIIKPYWEAVEKPTGVTLKSVYK